MGSAWPSSQMTMLSELCSKKSSSSELSMRFLGWIRWTGIPGSRFFPRQTFTGQQIDARYIRYQAEVTAGTTSTPSPKANASIPFSLSTVQATYRNLGYGADIEVCGTKSSTSSPEQSGNCTSLVANLNSTFPAELAGADLVWAWDKFAVNYVSLSHFDGAVFNVTGWIAMVG